MTSLLIAQASMNNYASITFIIDNLCSKTEIDTTLSGYHTKPEIDTTFNLNSPASQILNNLYSKLYIDNTVMSSTETGTRYYNKTETGNMLLSYSTCSYVDYTFYNKTETDTLLTEKVSNIGNIDLPGMLDIGTSGYTNSRIRCNAVVGGYTGYAELKAASSYDMFLNLPTTRTDGGWMYFKINNDDYMQLPGGDNKVNIYKGTTISGTLNAQRLSITSTISRPIEINNAMHNGPYLVATSQNHSNNDLLFALRCRPLNQLWCFDVTTSNQYIISHGN